MHPKLATHIIAALTMICRLGPGRLCFLFALTLWLGGASFTRAQVVTTSLSRTFTNPSPATVQGFGHAVAALGTDRVVIGAAGVAYLAGTNGTLLMTFTNPVPSELSFGSSVSTVGTDQVLIGAPMDDTGATDAGIAYLFATNGMLLTVFTNPTPTSHEFFGSAVTAFNADTVLIGCQGDGTFFYPGLGAAYLYSTDGSLITTITNPNPYAFFDDFGRAVRAVGTDKVLIGSSGTAVNGIASAGIAYLFSTNGTVLSTFTNPAPAQGDRFGIAVTSLGTDRVLIGANDSGAAGGVYLFATNGALLQTFFSPDPAGNELFGSCIAVIGDMIVIGAPQDDPGGFMSQTGTAYLFNTNGTLLRTILNPSPSPDEHFGTSLAIVGTNKVLIGADRKAMGGFRPGAAYLFSLKFLPPPALTIENLSGNSVRVSWPYPSTGFVLDHCGSLNSPPETNSWASIPPPYTVGSFFSNGVPYATWSVTTTIITNGFFRLRQP
jgi:hypothetical protein